jgi:hypothetical protein
MRYVLLVTVAAAGAVLLLPSSALVQPQEKELFDLDIGQVGAEYASDCFVSLPGANLTCQYGVVYCRDAKCEAMCRVLLAAKLSGRKLKRIRYLEDDSSHVCTMRGLMFE